MRVSFAHTAQLDPAVLDAARALLHDVFEGDFYEDDWEHSLGGLHALAWEDETLIGHAAVIQRRLMYDGRALRTGYVEGVGVRADRRGRGVGGAMMSALEDVIRGAYDLGALGATDEAEPLYLAPRLAALGGAAVGAHAVRHRPHGRGGGRRIRVAGRGRARPDGRAHLRLARRRCLVAQSRQSTTSGIACSRFGAIGSPHASQSP